MDNYGIRADYKARTVNATLDDDDRSFWVDSRVRESGLYQWHVYAYAAELVKQRSIKTVLDIGCGTAVKLMQQLAPITEVYGIDQVSASNACRERYGYPRFYADDFENPQLRLPVDFGLIVCSDVVEHVTNPDVLLAYIRRFSSSNTLVLLSTPDRDRLRGTGCLSSPKAEHIREWTFAEFSTYLRSRGFSVERHWHSPPVKTALNKLFVRRLWGQISRMRPYAYNQVALCSVSDHQSHASIV